MQQSDLTHQLNQTTSIPSSSDAVAADAQDFAARPRRRSTR